MGGGGSDSKADEPEPKLRRVGDWLDAEVDGELVMMSADTGVYLALSGSGARIWSLLESPMTLSEVCARLAREYRAPAEQLNRDVAPFVEKLIEQGALTLETPHSA